MGIKPIVPLDVNKTGFAALSVSAFKFIFNFTHVIAF